MAIVEADVDTFGDFFCGYYGAGGSGFAGVFDFADRGRAAFFAGRLIPGGLLVGDFAGIVDHDFYFQPFVAVAVFAVDFAFDQDYAVALPNAQGLLINVRK